MMRFTARFSWLAAAVVALAVLPACQRGGGSSENDSPAFLTITHTSFGYDPLTGSFNSTGQHGDPPIIPQNTCVVFEFNANLDHDSASSETIIVQEINTSVTPPAPGPDAGVTYRVSGNQLIICPLILFSDTNVSFGMQPNRTYQILFQVPPQEEVVRSRGGSPLRSGDRGPFRFKTNSQIFDIIPGAPKASLTLLDDANTILDPDGVPFRPVPRMQIDFNEPVIPTTVVSDPITGSSNSVSIQLDADGNLATLADRATIPGRYSLTQDDSSARLTWESLLQEIPTSANGLTYVVTIKGTVQDLAGNNRVILENDPGAKDEFVFRTLPGDDVTMPDPVLETFDVRDNEDKTVTSAFWGTSVQGFLSPGFGGGSGADGAFDPNDPVYVAAVNASAIDGIDIDTATMTATLDTVKANGRQRIFEFLSFTVPIGWLVRGVGAMPLSIQVSGNVLIQGTLDVSGADGELVAPFDINGNPVLARGEPGLAALAGASGGAGGSPLDSTSLPTFFPSDGRGATYPQLGFQNPQLNQGITGRASAIANFALTDDKITVDLSSMDVTNLWIQPNVGADDFRFERFHTAFKVEEIEVLPGGGATFHIISDPNHEDFRGPITAPTINPTLELVGDQLRSPLIAEQCDAYIIGELAGLPGSRLFDLRLNNVLRDLNIYRAGQGANPQAVMQTTLTTARSGGGGGGGGLRAGAEGQNDPTIDNGPGAFGGSGSYGADGGRKAPIAHVASFTATTMTLTAPYFLDKNGNFDPSLYVGFQVNPNIGQGHTFPIEAVLSSSQFTITPVPLVDGTALDFLSVSGLSAGATCRIEPPYSVGGSGGGGAGVHCAGSFKDPKGHRGVPSTAGSGPGHYDDSSPVDCLEDAQEQLFPLPLWSPGGGGGAGGGAMRLVTASDISVTTSGKILAEGGTGGASEQSGTYAASGGGGGAGGTIFLGAGRSVTISGSGRISAAGGDGGGAGIAVRGGRGADGRIRIESVTVNLDPVEYAGKTAPTLQRLNLGIFTGGGNSLAQSSFLSAGVLVPEYQMIIVTYDYVQNGVPTKGAKYIVNRNGSVAPGSTLQNPPFVLSVNATSSDSVTGLPVPPQAGFVDPASAATPISAFDGLNYIRFRVTLDDPSDPTFAQQQVLIDSIEIITLGGSPTP